MKRIFLTLFAVAVCSVLFAQRYSDFVAPDANGARSIADTVVNNAKRSYVFVKDGVSKDNGHYYFQYVQKADTNKWITISFEKKMIGANPSLEIEASKPEYVLFLVRGKYLDVFPFWKKFIDANANLEAIANKPYNVQRKELIFGDGKKITYTFQQEYNDGIWTIHVYYGFK